MRRPSPLATMLLGLALLAGCARVPPSAPVSVAVRAPWDDATRLAHYQTLASYGAAAPSSVEPIPVQFTGDDGRLVTATVVKLVFADGVFFDTGSDVALPASQSVLDVVADNLRHDVPGIQLTVVGHTDSVGGDADNVDLSRRRALGVIASEQARGIAPTTLSAVAMGKYQPIAPNDSADGRARNRRVEFYVATDLRANAAAIGQVPETVNWLINGPEPAPKPITQADLLRASPGGTAAIGTIPLRLVASFGTFAAPPVTTPRVLPPRPRAARPTVPVARVHPLTPDAAPTLTPVQPDAVAPAPLGPPQTY